MRAVFNGRQPLEEAGTPARSAAAAVLERLPGLRACRGAVAAGLVCGGALPVAAGATRRCVLGRRRWEVGSGTWEVGGGW